MATAKKSPLTEEESKERKRELARLRKQRFDAKMRNPEGSEDGNTRRGCVIFLSDTARDILKQNRERRRDAGLPQLLDSNLVESLLRAYANQGTMHHSAGELVIDETKADPLISSLLTKLQAQKRKLENQGMHIFGAEAEIESLTEELRKAKDKIDWETVLDYVLTTHSLYGLEWSVDALKRFRQDLSNKDEGKAAAAMNRALEEYIRSLIEHTVIELIVRPQSFSNMRRGSFDT